MLGAFFFSPGAVKQPIARNRRTHLGHISSFTSGHKLSSHYEFICGNIFFLVLFFFFLPASG